MASLAGSNSSPEVSKENLGQVSGSPSFFEDAREVKEVKESVGNAASIESGEGLAEGVEIVDKVSEVLSSRVREDKKGQGSSSQTSATSGMTPAQIREHLLKNLPSETVMKGQIEREIKKEIKYLHKKAIKMMRTSGDVNYFEMNNLMKKIRELKGVLIELIKASFDNLKTLWLRFVHGIM